jgi:hypothetical protein
VDEVLAEVAVASCVAAAASVLVLLSVLDVASRFP